MRLLFLYNGLFILNLRLVFEMKTQTEESADSCSFYPTIYKRSKHNVAFCRTSLNVLKIVLLLLHINKW